MIDIKTLLNLYGKIEVPYKRKMNEWFGRIELCGVTEFGSSKTIYVLGGSCQRQEFTDVDEAIKKFEEIAISNKNLAIKQLKWNSENPDKDPDEERYNDNETFTKEVKKIKVK